MLLRPFILLLPIFLAACGTSHKTVIVNPQPGDTVVVAPNGDAKVIKHDN